MQENDEFPFDLQTWRSEAPAEGLKERVVLEATSSRKRSNRLYWLLSPLAIALVFVFLFARPEPAHALTLEALHRLQTVQTVVVATELADPKTGERWPGKTYVAHGKLRRDGLRDMHGLRGSDGRWDYDGKTGQIRQDSSEGSLYEAPVFAQAFSRENIEAVFGPGEAVAQDLGIVVFGDRTVRLLKYARGTLTIDEATGLPFEVVLYYPDGRIGTARMEFDVDIDPEVFEPEALKEQVVYRDGGYRLE